MKRIEINAGTLVRLAALLSVGIASGCGGGGGQSASSEAPGDKLAPTVSGTVNANGALNVPINTKVGATFSEAMDASTITTATLYLAQGTTLVPGVVSYTGVSAVLIPSAVLAPGARYTVTVKGGAEGARDLAGNALARDYSWSWTTGATPDVIAPTITGTTNRNGTTNVAVNAKVGATFSEAMDPSTINAATFLLAQGTTAVPGAVSYSGVSAVLVPSAALLPGTRYVVTVRGGAGGAKDLAGNYLASDYSWAWTTGDSADLVAPTVSGTVNANGATNVAVNTRVGVTFSEAMDPLTITNKTLALAQGTAAVIGTVSYSGVTAVLIPSENLAPSTGYTATVKGGAGGAKDLAGNALASDYVWAWTTGAAADTGAPTVIETTIADGATNVDVRAAVGATFSEAMDPLSMTVVNCTLAETASGTMTGRWTVDYAAGSLTFHPDYNDFGPLPPSFLRPSTGYTVTIKGGAGGVSDLAGNPMAVDRVWSFTTGAAVL